MRSTTTWRSPACTECMASQASYPTTRGSGNTPEPLSSKEPAMRGSARTARAGGSARGTSARWPPRRAGRQRPAPASVRPSLLAAALTTLSLLQHAHLIERDRPHRVGQRPGEDRLQLGQPERHRQIAARAVRPLLRQIEQFAERQHLRVRPPRRSCRACRCPTRRRRWPRRGRRRTPAGSACGRGRSAAAAARCAPWRRSD